MGRKKQEEFHEPENREVRKRSFWGSFFRFIFTTPVWQMLLLGAGAAVVWWQWDTILDWYYDTLFKPMGWGIILVLGAIITFFVVTLRKQNHLFTSFWNRWFAGIVFLFVAWGIMAYFPARGELTGISLGGRFGLGIIGGTNTDLRGILLLILYVVFGLFLVSPKGFIRIIRRAFSWFVNQVKRPGYKTLKNTTQREYQKSFDIMPSQALARKEASRKPLNQEEIEDDKENEPFPEELRIKNRDRKKPEKGTPEESVKNERPSTPEEMKQVAQDVWKKYGQSPNLVFQDGWKLPPVDILDLAPEVHFGQADNSERARLIEEALSSYGVEAKVVQINAGPTVTQFGLEPGWDRKIKEIREKDKDGKIVTRTEEVSKTRVKVDRIASLQNDLALALTAPSIRIEAPVPGKGIVGIEVPNSITSMVSLRGVIESTTFQKLKLKTKLAIALGEGAGGEAVAGDLAKMPHLLIAGATGSGKTVCLNTIICCLLLNNTPSEVRFILIDPKRVELTTYKGIPHLAAPVIVEPEKAIEALRWLGREMNNRYQILAEARARNIEGFNKGREGKDRMPYLVLVIDELADLMMTGGDEVEQILCRLAQLARAVGIHLVVATQRPSVDVITGLIKANFPTRISFSVTSQVDSRTILDVTGAEKLLGNGDMLYLPQDASKPKRIQGCYVSDPEADRLVFFWGSQQKDEVAPLLKLDELARAAAGAKGEASEDSLMETARELAREHDNISTSFLQRRLGIGYPRAARIKDQLDKEMEEWDIEEIEDGLDEDDYD